VGTRTYGISNRTFRSAVVILVVAYAIFLLIIFLRAESDTWAILVIPTLPLLPLAYVLHKGNLAWLQIKDEEIEVTPSWFGRKFWSEQSRTVRFDSGSELLFCRRFAYGSFDGFFVILRSSSGADQALWSTNDNSTGVGRRWWSRIAREISGTSQLKTRLIEQTVNSQGMRESDWPTKRGKMLWQGLRAVVAPALAPWLGIGARLLTSDPIQVSGSWCISLDWQRSVDLVLDSTASGKTPAGIDCTDIDFHTAIRHVLHSSSSGDRRASTPLKPQVLINAASSDGRRNTCLKFYSQESGIPEFFLGVDSSAARPGRAALE
jgi:hypothetical protein